MVSYTSNDNCDFLEKIFFRQFCLNKIVVFMKEFPMLQTRRFQIFVPNHFVRKSELKIHVEMNLTYKWQFSSEIPLQDCL